MSLNKVTLIGNLGKDPEIRSTKDGKEIASFSIATTESWKDKQTSERKDKTEWHNITAFGAVVGVIKNYVKKGSKLYIEGKLETSKYTDKQGVEKYTTKVILQGFGSKLLMLDSKNNTQEAPQAQPQMSQQDSDAIDGLDDDIPF
jgi:single-strand DNA-binding protein